jgi:hypothetical protein
MGAEGRVINCPRCGTANPEGSRFCNVDRRADQGKAEATTS